MPRQPFGRGGVGRGIEGCRARPVQPRKCIGVTRRRRVRRMGRERRDLDHERRIRRLLLDEIHRGGGQDVGHVVVRPVRIVGDLAVPIEIVAKAPIAVAGDVPFAPSGRGGIALRLIAVEIFAEHRGVIAGCRQGGRECDALVAAIDERLVPAVGADIAVDAGIVGIASGEDRRARRTAQRIGHEIIREGHAVLLHLPHIGHVLYEV